MRQSEKIRFENTINDLIKLNVHHYCDLGPDTGTVALALHDKGKNVQCIDGPFEFEKRTAWKKDTNIQVHSGEFFSSKIENLLKDKVECFSLIHSIAHFRFPPQKLFKQLYNYLEDDGYFYCTTVNGGSLDRVLKLFRGGAITEEVKEYVNIGEEGKLYCNPKNDYMIFDSWTHVKEYRDFELKKIFEDCGFKVIKLFHRNNFQHWKQNLACKIWPHLSEEIIIVGQKL